MKLPDLDPSGGQIALEHVLLEYDGPQLIVARNRGGSKFLGLHTSSAESSDQWLYVRISAARLRELRGGLIPIRQPYAHPEYGEIALHAFQERGDRSVEERVQWLNANEIPDALLPAPDAFLEKDFDEAQLMVAASAAPEPVQRILHRASAPLWEFDQNVIDILKSLRTPPHIAARFSRRSVIDLAFAIDKGRVDFPVRSLSAVLGVTQSLVDALGVDTSEAGARGPLPGKVTGVTSLDAVATFPSSFGLRLETNVGDLAGETHAEVALRKLLYLLEAASTQEEIEAALRSISRRAQNHFKAFFKAVASGKADFKIEAATPAQESTQRVYFTGQQVRSVARYLEREVPADVQEFTFHGRLLGVSLKTKFFLLKSHDGVEISGKIAPECLSKIDEKKINVEHVAKVLDRTEVNEATGEETHKYTLIDIEEA